MSAPRSEARLLRALLLAAALLAPFTVTGLAQPAQTQPAEPQTPAPQETGPGILALLPPASVTQHEITLDRERLNYTATSGTLPLLNPAPQRPPHTHHTPPTADGAPPPPH